MTISHVDFSCGIRSFLTVWWLCPKTEEISDTTLAHYCSKQSDTTQISKAGKSLVCVCIKKGKKCLGQSGQMKLLKIWLKFLNTQSPLWINGLQANLMPIVGFPFPLGFWPLKFSGTCSLLPSNIFCKPFPLTFSRYSWFASDQLHRKENFYKTIGVGWRIELILAERKGGDI